jgi:adenylate cyclase
VAALAVLGETDRCRDWIRRALLIDPDNQMLRYNSACSLCVHLKDTDGALDLLDPYLAWTTRVDLDWAKVDPDMAPLHENPRFQAMIAAAEARLAAEAEAAPA